MNRYTKIKDVAFGQVSLPLAMSAKIVRHSEPLPAYSDNDAFVSNVQIKPPTISIELRIRDTAASESLSIGQSGALSFCVSSSDSQTMRQITLSQAVLYSIELDYKQSAMAEAVLKFVAVSTSGSNDPFAAQEAQ